MGDGWMIVGCALAAVWFAGGRTLALVFSFPGAVSTIPCLDGESSFWRALEFSPIRSPGGAFGFFALGDAFSLAVGGAALLAS